MNVKQKKVPYHRKPEGMTIDQWQIQLRKQYGIKQEFEICNIGNHPVFSDYTVYNPKSESTYKVSVRSIKRDKGNFCSCPDFKINLLGTCKHLEYVLYTIETDETKQLFLNDNIRESRSSLSIRYEQTRRLFLTKSTAFEDEINIIASDYFEPSGYLYPDKLNEINEFIDKARKIDSNFRVYPDVFDYISSLNSERKRTERLKNLFPDGVKSLSFNDLIKADLYHYQREGVLFCASAGRALLADDMGLGKTVQTLATVELYLKEFGIKKILVISPTSLKYQWQSEIRKFTGRDALVVEGAIHKRKKLYKQENTFTIISYGVVGNDREYINESQFDLLVLDEAQRIKNWKTKTAKNIKRIKTEYAIVLTGTPIENRIDELHSIVEFIDPYKLGILFRFLYKHQVYDESGKVIGYKELNGIRESLSDVLLRRTKKEISEQLPGRVDKTYFVGMTSEQKNFHDSYYLMVAQIVSIWKLKGVLSSEEKEQLLIYLNCMRMSCDSTYILDQSSHHDTKIDELMKILDDLFTDKKSKVVIFSQWARMHHLVERELEKSGIGYEFLHGIVPARKRDKLIKNFFNNPACRVFLSTDAGGVGLNLQCASVVINLDIPWNPAVLEQRIGRVYRLGQKESVRVINMVSHATIEHRILHLLDYKKDVFKGVLEDGEDTVLMNSGSIKSFMEYIEELTKRSSKDGIYITPHAELNDNDHDNELSEYETGNESSTNNLIDNSDKDTKGFGEKILFFVKKLKGLFR